MGQWTSKELARQQQLTDEQRKATQLLDTLMALAAEEAAVGNPDAPGSHKARHNAAWDH